ncbi:MAG: 30S ribosomal protein S13 [Candidatus Paceibacterota bacterium]
MRIAGINIPPSKRLDIALTAVYGVGRMRAAKILDAAAIDRSRRADSLSVEEENKIRQVVEAYRIEGDLKKEIAYNIKRLKSIQTYRGTRHLRGLPARGQRTKTNSRTRRGNVRKTMGSGRKKVEKK